MESDLADRDSLNLCSECGANESRLNGLCLFCYSKEEHNIQSLDREYKANKRILKAARTEKPYTVLYSNVSKKSLDKVLREELRLDIYALRELNASVSDYGFKVYGSNVSLLGYYDKGV